MNEIPDPNSSVTSVESRLLSRIRRRATADRIARRDISGPLPLSFAQQRLWFLDQLEPGGAEYLMPCALRITGTLDLDALEAALSGLVTRHEVLRTRFVADDTGQPAQLVEAPWPVSVTVHDLRTDGELTDRQATARELLRNAASLPFELTAGRPLRADLVRMTEDEQYLLLTVHHIASDGWSQGILARELRALYAAALTGQAAELPEPAVQYADFALWQRQRLTGTTLERQLGYWREQLAGIEPLELPTDHRRPARHGGSGDSVLFSVPAEVTERLKSAAASEGASLFMVLLGVFQLLLSKYSGQQDIAVGTPIAGRNRAEIEDVIGFFVNTLVLRTDLAGDPTFGELLARVKEAALGAYDHQDLPFERLVEELAPERDLSRNPLFQTMLVLQAPESSGESGDGGWGLAGTRVEPVELKRGIAKFDLTLNLVESGDGLLAALEYRTDLFEPATMERLVGHFQTLLAGVAARPEARLSELEMLTAAERQQIVVDWNATGGDYPDTATIHSLIEERCERDPDAIALTYGDTVLTYRQVNERANQLAHHLRDQGVTPDTLIAVCLDRSPDLICALLGILKAGAAFVPLDPDYPTDRITYMIEDTATPLVITHSLHASRLPTEVPLLLVDQDWPTAAATSNPAPIATPDHLAYLIYTSGSTGRPKGVQLDHRGVVNYLHWCDQNYPTQTDNGIGTLLYSSVTFDLTITALFLPLIQGQQLAIPVPTADQSAFDAAIDLILTGTEISFLKATPSHLELLTTHLEHSGKRHNIATIVAGGEDLSPTLANRILTTGTGHTVIANEYGATEGSVANVMSLSTTIDPTTSTTSVGTPITNTTAYIVDRHDHPVPIGIPGECLLGGICVARGYHNRPELTTTRFVDLDLNGATERVYRTGDLVRWREDGHMEFIGRIDNQVKLRGYRIELGEIENNLLTHPTITATTVVLRQDTPGDKRLVAYLTAAETAPSAGELRAHLQQHLPDYMIPTSYVVLDHLPLTPNGKVDQKALPAPDSDRPDLDAAYLAPRTPVEQTITAIWSEILGVDPIGIHDNFFQLGGHSLLATQVTSRLRKELGVEVPVRSVFTAPTPAQLAHAIADLGADLTTRLAPAPRDGSPLPLSFAQQRLWFLDQLEPGSAEYLVPVGLHLRGWLDVAALQTALSGLVARHEVLRTRFLADEDGHPAQLVDAPHPVTVTIHDLSGIADAEAREAAAQELMAAEGARPFDLAAGRPLRADLVRLAPDEQYLLLTVHHIVSDGWSEGILARELRELYTAAVQQRTAELPDAAVQYADFAVWQRRWLAGEALDRQLDYWQAQLAGIEPLELPTDHRRPAERGGDGDAVRFSVPAEVTEQLKVATADQGASLFMTLLAVFQLLLSKYSGQQDITVGTPIAGRNRAEVEEMIGFFVNTLVLRADLSGDPTFRQLLEQVKETALGAYDHQDLPFERLVDELAPERDLSRNPLFQTMFVLQNVPDGEGTWALPGLAVEQVGIGGQAVKFDLQLTVVENGGGLDASVEYRTDLFEPATMERLVGHFQTLLAGVAARPEARLSELEMLTAAERQQIVVDWNATGGDYPDTATIHSLIEERCAREPDAIALTCGDTVLTCRQVNERANQLAHHLRDQGVTPDTLIAVCLDRSPDLICALLGILKAGAAFVPLDPDYPTDRITYMVEDTATPLVITHSRHTERLPSGTSILLVDQGWPATADTSNPIPTATPDHLAYLIYTSGSTGRPKGVQLDHRGVVNYLHWCDQNYPAITPNGIGTLLYSSVTFDLTITALFLPLIQGQQLAIPQPAPDQSAFDATIDLILTGTEISFLKATPSHLELLTTQLELTGTKHNIATIVAGGEELTPTLANRIFTTSTRTTVIANEYGATEGSVANVMSLSTTIDPTTGTTPVGTAITNTTAYVVDRFNHPVPIGIPGECLLGGICVARGYHNRPELTTTRFIQDPFSTDPTARAYRTGDLVRWREDGHMEFIGRIDNQVKLRGYRIELGEIENNLLTHPTITATTVVLRQDTPGDKRLVAYLVSTNTPTITELRTHLQHHLPDYMIPTTYITLPHLPLTPNGKVDQKALPTPDHHRPDLDATYTPPRTPVEQTLAAIWSEILGVDPIGIHDNFFELGGDSIISIQVIAKAKKFGLHLTPRMIFKYQTIAEIAGHAQSGASANAEQGKVLGDVALTPIQHWFFEKELPSGHHFNQAELLATECLDPTVLERALTDLTEHHDALRLRYRRADDSSWTQHSADSAGRGLLDVHDLSEVSDEGLWSVLRGIGEEVQRSLDLADGPILRGALLNLGGERGQRFLLTVHHLAIDSVSWRILLEDLGSAYERRAAGRAPQLPPKTTSFKAWAEKLSRFAVSAEAEAEFGYWSESKPSGRLPRDRDGANEARSADTVSATLTPKETSALLREVPRAFNTQINDALLTALARAVARWTGDGRTLIGLEGHGREDLFSDVDLSRTIGWFTSVFPVALTVDPAADPVSSLAAVKEQLARIPNKGVGYGILRYLGRPEVTDVLQAQPSPEVNFNYLGQFTEQLPGIGRYADPTEPKGHSISPDGMRWNVLDITAAVEGDTFHLNINYSAALHNRRTVERLAADLLDGLRQLISAGAEQSEGPARATEGTPLTDVSATDMAAILKRFS